MTRRGFTLIELLIAMSIIGILAGIAIPNYHDAVLRADAAKVISDFEAIRVAAYDNYANTGLYPANGGWGGVPAAFVGSLPNGFQFSYKDVTYRWRRWALPNGMPRNNRQTMLLGVQIRTGNRDLMRIIKNTYGGTQAQGNNRRVTFVIE